MSSEEAAYAHLKRALALARKHGFGTKNLVGVVEHPDGSVTAYRTT